MTTIDSIEALQIATRGLVALLNERGENRLNSFFPAGFDPKTIQTITDSMTPESFATNIAEVATLLQEFSSPPREGAFRENLQNLVPLKDAFEAFTLTLVHLVDCADLSALLERLDAIVDYLIRRIEATREC